MTDAASTTATVPRAEGTAPRGTEGAPLAALHDVLLLDLDGVVTIGDQALPHAVDALHAARTDGLSAVYVTNNDQRAPHAVAAHLTGLGVPAGAHDVVTAAQALAQLAAADLPPGARVLTVGGGGLRSALLGAGLTPVASADEAPQAVALGYTTTLNWAALSELCYAVSQELPWYATCADPVLRTPRGLAPGVGAAVAAVTTATGRTPRVAGKPAPALHREAIARGRAHRPLAVGDRLDTDMAGAHAAGAATLLVLTGTTRPAELLGAQPGQRPTHIGRDLRDLLVAHPAVHSAADGYTCAGWHATHHPPTNRITVTGDGNDPLDGLRALCATSWNATDTGAPLPDLTAALARLGW
ncbi:HAD-IIA family hydrolase [Streptomyces kanamyceticus]|uniref:HAD-IIA family hydrolase n=1 Tax=Streptomyces kanamyceticus TaxID=1967 RepID=UPI0006E4079E|nr:HAD-IIA family hydrolase [Streptomyces kanamyceticus]